MLKVGRVMDTLKEEYPELASKVTPVFVSIDPARDSLKVLEEYAKDFHPSFVFLTGTPKQVSPCIIFHDCLRLRFCLFLIYRVRENPFKGEINLLLIFRTSKTIS